VHRLDRRTHPVFAAEVVVELSMKDRPVFERRGDPPGSHDREIEN